MNPEAAVSMIGKGTVLSSGVVKAGCEVNRSVARAARTLLISSLSPCVTTVAEHLVSVSPYCLAHGMLDVSATYACCFPFFAGSCLSLAVPHHPELK